MAASVLLQGLKRKEELILDTVLQQRKKSLEDYPFFNLQVTLKEGHDLKAMDNAGVMGYLFQKDKENYKTIGTSDPYVKFAVGKKQLYKSRIIFKSLNPEWNENFTLPIDNPFLPVSVKVYDYDYGFTDDDMGCAELDLTSLDLNVPTDLRLNLMPENQSEKKEFGFLLLQCTLVPKTEADKQQLSQEESQKKVKAGVWSSVLTVVLVDGEGLSPMDDNGSSDPYVKFKLGPEKYKSKVKPKTLSPVWLEQFDLHMFDSQRGSLEISVWDRDVTINDDLMGRAEIKLNELDQERTHVILQKLQGGAGHIRLLVTITGTVGPDSVADLATYRPNPADRTAINRRYALYNVPRAMRDVGWLQVKVIGATGLLAADINGKSDPFCVVELVNARLQTHTEYKTLSPQWGRIFEIPVKDIHSLLEVTVYDEDRDKKVDFLGKVAIPLLKVRCGERKWYTLKDQKLTKRAKGAILLEMDLAYNDIRAAIRTINPAEPKYMKPAPKFKLAVMKRNIDRVKVLGEAAAEGAKLIHSCLQWDSYVQSIIAYTVYMAAVWLLEPYMVPIALLIVFLQGLVVVQVKGHLVEDRDQYEYDDDEESEEEEETYKDQEETETDTTMAEDENTTKKEKQSFKEKLNHIHGVCLQVQEGMDMAASMGERVKNTFNWTVPWLSWLAVIILIIASFLVYYLSFRVILMHMKFKMPDLCTFNWTVPWLSWLAVIILIIASFLVYYLSFRVILMLWGTNKFLKRFRLGRNYKDNNELMDFLSRVPSDKELVRMALLISF